MKYLKRWPWFLAWAFWAWLGLGLHRELPRDLGPVVCRLPLREWERFYGFLDDGREAVAHNIKNDPGQRSAFRVWDVATGELKRQFNGPIYTDHYGAGVSHQHGVAVVRRSMRPNREAMPQGRWEYASLLDFRTGEWTDLDAVLGDQAQFHPRRPWCLLRRGSTPEEYKVIDLRTKEVLFRWSSRDRAHAYNATAMFGYFIGDDHIAIAIHSRRPTKPNESWTGDVVEVWPVDRKVDEPQYIRNVVLAAPIVGSANRLAWPSAGGAGDRGAQVFDLNAGRLIAPDPKPLQPRDPEARKQLALSRDGARVLVAESSRMSAALWDVDYGRVLWKSQKHESCLQLNSDDLTREECFEVQESWTGWFDRVTNWLSRRRPMTTIAYRRFRDASIAFRTWGDPSWGYIADSPWGPMTYVHNVDTKSNEIHRLPFRVNYSLLALCQSILALPLILLWLLLRWRRKKRAQSVSDGSLPIVTP